MGSYLQLINYKFTDQPTEIYIEIYTIYSDIDLFEFFINKLNNIPKRQVREQLGRSFRGLQEILYVNNQNDVLRGHLRELYLFFFKLNQTNNFNFKVFSSFSKITVLDHFHNLNRITNLS